MTPRRRASIISFTFSAVVFVSLGAAWARGGGEPPLESLHHFHACRLDVRRFCADTEPGRDRIRCLESHESELSEACRQHLAERRSRH